MKDIAGRFCPGYPETQLLTHVLTVHHVDSQHVPSNEGRTGEQPC